MTGRAKSRDAIAYKSPNSKCRGDSVAPSKLWGVRWESAIKHFSATIDGLNPQPSRPQHASNAAT